MMDHTWDEHAPPFDGPCSVIRSEVVEGVLLLTPTVSRLDDEATIADIRDRLEGLLAGDDPPPRVVMDLASLVSLSGWAIGVILTHQVRLRRSGGCLRLARASDPVATTMKIVGLPSQIEVFSTVDEAMLARWPA